MRGRAAAGLLLAAGLLQEPATRAELGTAFAAWCADAKAYLTGEVNALATDHEETAAALQAAANETRSVNAKFAALARDALPQSTDPGAGVAAAHRAAEASQSPEYAELLKRRVAAKVAYAGAYTAFHDAEALQRALEDLLGASLRDCRQEADLDAAVQRALAPGGHLYTSPLLLRVRAELREVPMAETLDALKARKEHLAARVAECAHLRAGRQRVEELKSGGEAHAAAAHAAEDRRADGAAGLLAEFRALDKSLATLEAADVKLFEEEKLLYANEVTGGEGNKKLDAAHSFWMEWRKSLAAAFENARGYLKQRETQLVATEARFGYLRAQRRPEAQYAKTLPPDGLHCPGEAEEAQLVKNVDDAIAQITALGP